MAVTIAPPPFLYFPNNNNSGSPAVGFKLFQYQAGTTTKQSTWTDSTQTVTNANPLQLDSNGVAANGASSGMWGDPTVAYKLVWAPANDTDPPSSPIRTIDNLYFPLSLAALTQQVIGQITNPRTAAEIAAGVTPTNYAYAAPGTTNRVNAFRYMTAAQIADVIAGTSTQDVTTALQTLFTVCQKGYVAYLPQGIYKISGGLTFDGTGGIVMEGASFTYLNCTGSGYTALSIATQHATNLTELCVQLQGNGNAINGVKIGADGTAGKCLQGSVVNYINCQSFAGFGIQINDCFDSVFHDLAAVSCGTSTQWAVSINNATNSTNQCVFGHIQAELATDKAFFVDQVLCCTFNTVHSERATGDGTNPTHSLGGDSTSYNVCYLTALSNGLINLTGTNCRYGNIRASGVPVSCSNGNAFTYQSNRVEGMICGALTLPSSNVNGWNFQSCNLSSLTYTSQNTGCARFNFCTIGNITANNNGSTAEFIDCNLTGTWTVTGNPIADIRGGVCANFPTTNTVLMDNVTVTNAYTTAFGQQITATRCTFNGTITLQNSNVNWKSDACTFGAVTLGTGAPGWLFGPRDRATGAVSAGLLQSPSAFGTSGVAYVLGDKGYNLQAPAAGSFAWTCTTAGSPGTFTNVTIP